MNKFLTYVAGAAWLAAAVGTDSLEAAPLEAGLVAHVHFAGGDAVAADPNAGPLKNMWSSPEAMALRTQTLDKLDHFLDVWVTQQIAPNLASPVQVRPLLADLGDAEWQLDLRQPTGDTVEFSLSVRLNSTRASAWLTTLAPVVEAWKKTSPAHHGQVIRNGDWLVLQLGNATTPAPVPAVSGLEKSWLTVDVDWTRLSVWVPEARVYELPQTHLAVVGRNGNFEVNGKLFLAQPLSPLEKWQFPTNTIHSPYASITAARGISSWLKQQPWVMSLGFNPLPDQVFAWALPQIAFQSYAAMPMADAPAALPKLQPALESALHGGSDFSPYKRLTLSTTNNQLALTGMPWMAPYFQPIHEASGEFLLAGCFPNNPRGRPAPAEFFVHLNEPGLVFYHWEDTGVRFKMFPQLYQLVFAMSNRRQVQTNSAAGNWLEHLKPTLGLNTTTVTETTPSELTFTRQASSGFTAVEYIALVSWLDAPNFPGWDLRLPPRRPPPHRMPGPGSQPPFTLHH